MLINVFIDNFTSIIRNSFNFKNGNRRYKYLGIWPQRCIFCEGALWIQKQVLWKWHLYLQSLLSTEKKQMTSQFNYRIRIHRWRFVYEQPRVWELPGPEISFLIWDQRHSRERHFCFLPGFAPVERVNCQLRTSIYDKRDYFNFNITNFPFLKSSYSIFACL